MNRLWVRLSLMISGVLFFVFFLQFLSIVLTPDHEPIQRTRNEHQADEAEIAWRLAKFGLFSLLVGLTGGVITGRIISAPISDLAKAARRVGQGELTVRVTVRGSQEMMELAETFNKMAADLERAETLRHNLMADVSHELRTPLTVLEGNLRAALDHIYALDEAEIANLYGQTRHLIRLVNDLRELTLAESHRLPLEKQPTDLNALVTETLQALEPLAVESEVCLIDQLPPLPKVTVDTIRMRQVLFNLLTNALRHTPPDGKITVLGTLQEHEMKLIIQDNGDGLESEQLLAVFDRFYRTDKSRSRETGGTGLGLAIVKAIIEAHDGHIEAKSAGKGQGSQFIVTLPC